MRHRKSGVKLNRTTSHRQAMFRNMVTSLFKHDRIKTTETKAKELRRWADHVVTLAKRGDLHARRIAMSIVREKDVVHKIFEEAAERFGSINGGYTRIIRIGRRPGDAAPLTLVELVSADSVKPAPIKKTKKAAAPSPTPTPAPAEAESAAAVDAGAESKESAELEAAAGETAAAEEAEAQKVDQTAQPVDEAPQAAADAQVSDEVGRASEDSADEKK